MGEAIADGALEGGTLVGRWYGGWVFNVYGYNGMDFSG